MSCTFPLYAEVWTHLRLAGTCTSASRRTSVSRNVPEYARYGPFFGFATPFCVRVPRCTTMTTSDLCRPHLFPRRRCYADCANKLSYDAPSSVADAYIDADANLEYRMQNKDGQCSSVRSTAVTSDLSWQNSLTPISTGRVRSQTPVYPISYSRSPLAPRS